MKVYEGQAVLVNSSGDEQMINAYVDYVTDGALKSWQGFMTPLDGPWLDLEEPLKIRLPMGGDGPILIDGFSDVVHFTGIGEPPWKVGNW